MSDTTSQSHKSLWATVFGAVMWILTGSGAAIVSHFLPAPLIAILHPLGELLTAIGAAFSVHANTQAAVATTAAVKQVTVAPVDLAPNPSIVAAQAKGAAAALSRSAGSPLQGS